MRTKIPATRHILPILREICLLGGASAIVYGVTLYDYRAAWIVGGAFLTAGSIAGMIRGKT